MPNWNTNSVSIDAPHEQVRDYLATREDKLYFNMAKLFPKDFPASDPTGHDCWNYDWALEHTGTKWFPEVWITSNPAEPQTSLGYDTAWGPNNGTLQRLHELTGRTIINEYEEPGAGFEGTFACEDGSCSDDQRDYLSPCEICEEKKADEEFDDEADDHICNSCRERGPHTSTIKLKLSGMIAADLTIKSYAARYIRDLPDPIGFLQHLARHREGDAIIKTFADEFSSKRFFDLYYGDLQATLALMYQVGAMPEFNGDGDLRGSLGEAAFLFVAEKIADELGLPQLDE